ncbi:MAG: crossover junction endodeoxyribonuclease RuvC [Saprospiraceae bacterium]
MNTKKKNRRIIGIDPGTNILGFAILDVQGNSLSIVEMNVLYMKHLETHTEKLKHILFELQAVIDKYSPTEMAIEAPFFGKNVQSMLKLGRAQGVAMAAGLSKNLIVEEYAPREIKQSVTGKGNASKEQVYAMLKTIFNKKIEQEYLDSSDALAAAVCHYFKSKNAITGGKRYNSWSSFVKENPKKKL